MTYPPPAGTPNPDQPQPPQFQPIDPYAPPASGAPASGQPAYPPPYGTPGAPPYTQDPYAAQQPPYGMPQQYGMQQYGSPQQYGAGYGVPPRTNPLAIASLVCSLAGLITCFSAPVGIVLGHIAKRQIRQTGEQGAGLATAGLWVGYIITGLGLAFVAFWVVLLIIGVMSGETTY